jgi:GNAT superfamily N-acetyltransferase
LKDLNNELLKVREVYNAAWEKNLGFVPMTEDEFYYTSESLRLLVREDLVFFAEVNNKPVGFSLSLPDYNQVFKKLNGKLFPFGLFKFYANRKKIDTIRVLIMGIVPEYQRKGIDGVFVYHTIKNSIAAGYTKAEISWVLEDNLPMIQTAEKLGAKIYKTYRLYEKQI